MIQLQSVYLPGRPWVEPVTIDCIGTYHQIGGDGYRATILKQILANANDESDGDDDDDELAAARPPKRRSVTADANRKGGGNDGESILDSHVDAAVEDEFGDEEYDPEAAGQKRAETECADDDM